MAYRADAVAEVAEMANIEAPLMVFIGQSIVGYIKYPIVDGMP